MLWFWPDSYWLGITCSCHPELDLKLPSGTPARANTTLSIFLCFHWASNIRLERRQNPLCHCLAIIDTLRLEARWSLDSDEAMLVWRDTTLCLPWILAVLRLLIKFLTCSYTDRTFKYCCKTTQSIKLRNKDLSLQLIYFRFLFLEFSLVFVITEGILCCNWYLLILIFSIVSI